MFNFDITIDLHGYDRATALTLLEETFFSEVSRSIMIIHGRGDGSLKNAVREFIRRKPHISGYEWGENLNLPGQDGISIVYT